MSCSGHSHDHEHSAQEVSTFLREFIDFSGVTCLNENLPNSGKSILKEYVARTSPHPSLHSQLDGDPELILYIPFTEAVSITHMSIRGPAPTEDDVSGSSGIKSCPKSVKLFVNRDDVDFSVAEDLPPTMSLELVHPDHEQEVTHHVSEAGGGQELQQEHERLHSTMSATSSAGSTIDYPLRPVGRFQNLTSITLYFPDNFASENDRTTQTEISYVGFKGKGTAVKRRAVDARYEVRAMPEDHKTPGNEYHNQFGL